VFVVHLAHVGRMGFRVARRKLGSHVDRTLVIGVKRQAHVVLPQQVLWGAPKIPDSGSDMILVWNGDRYGSAETHLFTGVPR
jgi:hypothetical protein